VVFNGEYSKLTKTVSGMSQGCANHTQHVKYAFSRGSKECPLEKFEEMTPGDLIWWYFNL